MWRPGPGFEAKSQELRVVVRQRATMEKARGYGMVPSYDV